MRPGLSLLVRSAALMMAGTAGLVSATAVSAQAVTEVVIRNHRFTPTVIPVPAGKPAVLHIRNADPLAEEFDSPALKIEKVIAGGQDGNVRLRPLDKGSYPFTGEYHADTARGVVIAR